MNRARFLMSALLLLSLHAHAAEFTPKWFMEGGAHFGGESLPANGPHGITLYDINGGELLTGSIGLIYDFGELVRSRVSFGFKTDGLILSENTGTRFNRFPLEAIIFTNGGNINIGAGVSYHFNPIFTASGILGDSDISFKNAFGYVIEVDIKMGEKAYMGIKKTLIEYEAEAPYTSTIDGNSFGIVIGLYF